MAIFQQLRNRYFFLMDIILLAVAVVLTMCCGWNPLTSSNSGQALCCSQRWCARSFRWCSTFRDLFALLAVRLGRRMLLLTGTVTLGVAISGALALVAAWVVPAYDAAAFDSVHFLAVGADCDRRAAF